MENAANVLPEILLLDGLEQRRGCAAAPVGARRITTVIALVFGVAQERTIDRLIRE